MATLVTPQVSHSGKGRPFDPPQTTQAPRVELELGNGDRLKCELSGINDSRLHLNSTEAISESMPVKIHFDHLTLLGQVAYCNQKADHYRICIDFERDGHNRREPRFPLDDPCRATILDENGCRCSYGTLNDLSRSGIGLRLRDPSSLGSMMCVETCVLLIVGEVRYCKQSLDGDYVTGLATDTILSDAEVAHHLPRFMATRRKLADWILGRPVRW